MIDLAIEAATKAGSAIMKHYPAEPGMAFSLKDDTSPVTEADLLSDRIVREILATTGIPIVSEEFLEMPAPRVSRVWLVDPLDGTKDFLAGSHDFCVMIALIEDGRPALAAIYAPADNVLYAAERGKGACMRDSAGERSLTVSQKNSKGTIFTASVNHFTKEMQSVAEHMGSRIIKRGSNGIKAGLIAEGKAEYTFSPFNFSPWDVAAPQLLVEEAGGKVSGMSGDEIRYDNWKPLKNGFIASNGAIHQELLGAVAEVLKRLPA